MINVDKGLRCGKEKRQGKGRQGDRLKSHVLFLITSVISDDVSWTTNRTTPQASQPVRLPSGIHTSALLSSSRAVHPTCPQPTPPSRRSAVLDVCPPHSPWCCAYLTWSLASPHLSQGLHSLSFIDVQRSSSTLALVLAGGNILFTSYPNPNSLPPTAPRACFRHKHHQKQYHESITLDFSTPIS